MKGTVKIGGEFWLSNHTSAYFSRHQRRHGSAVLTSCDPEDYPNSQPWATVSLKELRQALDTITLEDEEATIYVRLRDYNGVGDFILGRADPEYAMSLGYGKKTEGKAQLRVQLGNGGSMVRVSAPCGDTRVFRVKTLDHALSELGA